MATIPMNEERVRALIAFLERSMVDWPYAYDEINVLLKRAGKEKLKPFALAHGLRFEYTPARASARSRLRWQVILCDILATVRSWFGVERENVSDISKAPLQYLEAAGPIWMQTEEFRELRMVKPSRF